MFEKWKAITPNQTVIKHPFLFLNELLNTNVIKKLMLPEIRDDYDFQEWWHQWARFSLAINHFNLELQHFGCLNVMPTPSTESVQSRLSLDRHPWGLGCDISFVFTLRRFDLHLQGNCDAPVLQLWSPFPLQTGSHVHIILQTAVLCRCS